MANEQNLKPLNTLAKSVQREIQSKGGKARAEKIRERKTLREELLTLLEEGDNQKKISLSLIQEAMTGNTKAYEIIRDTIGEKPTEKQEQITTTLTYEDYIKKVENKDEY